MREVHTVPVTLMPLNVSPTSILINVGVSKPTSVLVVATPLTQVAVMCVNCVMIGHSLRGWLWCETLIRLIASPSLCSSLQTRSTHPLPSTDCMCGSLNLTPDKQHLSLSQVVHKHLKMHLIKFKVFEVRVASKIRTFLREDVLLQSILIEYKLT